MKSHWMGAAVLGAALVLSPVATADVAPEAPAQVTTEQQIDGVYGTHEGFREFFDALQKAAAARDKAALAGMIKYPFETQIAGKQVTLTSEADAVGTFDSLFSLPVLKDVTDQKWEELFVNYQGVMIGNGAVWFSPECLDTECKKLGPVKIIAINQPG